MATFNGAQTATSLKKAEALRDAFERSRIAEKAVLTREFGQNYSPERSDYNPALKGSRAERDRFVETYTSARNPALRTYPVLLRFLGDEGFAVIVQDKHSMRRVLPTREAADRVYNAINDWTTKTTLRRRGFSEW